ncbi:hypothetical protein MMC21_006139 [Puttea exsequens]|nr:hypothetical protein [Puttea exsequens]
MPDTRGKKSSPLANPPLQPVIDQPSHGLPTPASTPGSDTARIEAEEGRRLAEAASSEADASRVPASVSVPSKKDKGKARADEATIHATADAMNEDADGAGDEESGEKSPPQPDGFCNFLYTKATPHFTKLFEDPNNQEAKQRLEYLNQQIQARNWEQHRKPDECIIKIPTILSLFELARPHYEALQKNPLDAKARDMLEKINRNLDEINRRYMYPTDWTMGVPAIPNGEGPSSQPAGQEGVAIPDGPDGQTPQPPGQEGVQTRVAVAIPDGPDGQTSQTPDQGGVRTRVAVAIPDESDGRTSLGKVVNVRRAGYGYRVMVNRGTDTNLYCEIYPGSAFGKSMAKEWYESGDYASEDLPKDFPSKELEIRNRAKVKMPASSRRQIILYSVTLRGRVYTIPRSVLVGLKGLSETKLRAIDEQVDQQGDELRRELDLMKEDNKHPDTGKALTSADIEDMPWLSSDGGIGRVKGEPNEEVLSSGEA